MSEKDEENYKNNNICYFCEQEILDKKIRDNCKFNRKLYRTSRFKLLFIYSQKRNEFYSNSIS